MISFTGQGRNLPLYERYPSRTLDEWILQTGMGFGLDPVLIPVKPPLFNRKNAFLSGMASRSSVFQAKFNGFLIKTYQKG